jgi:MFS family permease
VRDWAAEVSGALVALRYRDFRFYAATQVCSLVCTWMQRVAQDWAVLELSHGSGIALGVTIAAQFAPTLLFGLIAGAWVDRLPIKGMVIAEQLAAGTLALILAVLSATGVLAVWHIVVLATLLGLCTVASFPLQQTLFAHIVPSHARRSAIALNSTAFHVGRVVGAGLVGPVVAACGVATAFVANAVSFAFVAVAVAMMHPLPKPRLVRAPGQVKQGLAYVAARPDLLMVMVIGLAMNSAAMPVVITLLPLLAVRLSVTAPEFGALSMVIAIGAVVGQLEAARHATPRLRQIVIRIAVLALVVILTSLMPPTLAVLLVMAVPLAAASYGWAVLVPMILHERTAPLFLGRAMALWYTIGAGTIAVGPAAAGWLATAIGPRATIGVCGALTALIAAWGYRQGTTE